MNVAVVGAGPAGLRTAQLLQAGGANLTVFEARGRIGGKLETIKLDGGGFYDSGAEWLDSTHFRVLALIEEQCGSLVENSQWPGRILFRGFEYSEETLSPGALDDVARFEEACDLYSLDLEPEPWSNVLYSDLDNRTLGSLVDSVAHSMLGRWYLRQSLRSDEGDEVEQIGLLGRLCSALLYSGEHEGDMSRYVFPHGAQRFCENLSGELDIRLNQVLRRVERVDDRLFLYFDEESAEFDKVVLAIPPPCLGKIIFDPDLSHEKQAALECVGMSRASKIALQFDRPFWKESGWNGRMLCDSPIQQTWDSSRDSAHVLQCYVCGEDYAWFAAQADPVASAVELIAQIEPRASNNFVSGRFHDWTNEPFSLGAFSNTPPEYVLNGMKAMRQPEGNIHFAGEHTSDWVGFVEGALESAERVAREVFDAE